MFELAFTFVPENPIFMQPKATYHFETNTDYYASPRKMIRFMEVLGKNFIFCDTFSMQNVAICTQMDSHPGEPGYDPDYPFKIEVEIKTRCEIIKPFMFQRVLLSTFESACKNGCKKFFEPHFERKLREAFEELKQKEKMKK